MAVDIGAIREALVGQVALGIDRQVNRYAYQPNAPQLPAVICVPGDEYVAYHESFAPNAAVSIQFDLLLLAAPGPDVDGQILLDQLLSAGTGQGNSVIDAIEADRTLGGTVHDAIVRTASSEGRIDLDDTGNTKADVRRVRIGIVLQRG